MAFHWNVRVRFVDTDASGRIHYTAMLRFFEAAEFEFLRDKGVSYEALTELSFPRVHVECDYTAAAVLDDLLAISVTVEGLGTTSFTYAFRANRGGQAIAAGKITVVCIARETMRPAPVPHALRTALTLL